ncbi:MAG: TonB-dependent receptor, partial [Pseudomonadota bacterium]
MTIPFQSRCILAALLATSALSQPVVAQESTDIDTADAFDDVDEIVVSGSPIRDSQAAAIERKRNAVNVVDIINADFIGRFPDQNLADSLGRVPGLAIERDQGQARFINFRGAPFRFTSIAFDGIDVPGAENGRVPRFDSFPAAITSAIAVNKAITPNMPGEAVAGFINIETFKPFDLAGFHFSLEGGYGEQALGGVGIERYNGRVSYSNDVFGVLAFGSYNKRGRITDNREYELQQTADGGIIPNNLDFRSYRGEREDTAYGGSLEFRPTDDTRIFISTIYSEFLDREERNQFDFDFADDTPGVSQIGTPITPDTGFQPVVVVQRLLEDGNYDNSTWTSTIGFGTSIADWEVDGRLAYIETQNDTFLPIPFSAGGVVAASYDVTDVLNPQVSVFDSGAALADGSMVPIDINSLTYPANFGLIFANSLETENYKLKLDAARDMDLFDRETRVQAGIQIDLRDATGGDTLDFGGFPSSVDINSFVTTDPWDSDFDNTINATNYDNIGLIDAWEAAVGGFDVPFDPESLVGIDEDIFAIYAMATTQFEWGNIVYGARIEHTDFSTNGTQLINGVESAITGEKSYTNVLPSLHVNIDLREDLKLRVSATTGVSRPTYIEARASVTVDAVELEATGGNPDLDAEYAYGGDVSLEYYFAEASLLSIGGFVRFVDNVLYADGVTLDDGSFLAPGLIAPGTPTVFNSFFNGEDGSLYGLELNFVGQATFLPEPFDGFGASGNITFLDSEFTAPTQNNAKFSLPGTSDLVFNASLFYEKFGFS